MGHERKGNQEESLKAQSDRGNLRSIALFRFDPMRIKSSGTVLGIMFIIQSSLDECISSG